MCVNNRETRDSNGYGYCWVSATSGFWKYSFVVGITAAATHRQVQKRISAKVVKRLCRKIKVGAP